MFSDHRPSHPFSSLISSPVALKHIEGTVVTQRDGSRILEQIDRQSGAIEYNALTSAHSTCVNCGASLGFVLEVGLLKRFSYFRRSLGT